MVVVGMANCENAGAVRQSIIYQSFALVGTGGVDKYWAFCARSDELMEGTVESFFELSCDRFMHEDPFR